MPDVGNPRKITRTPANSPLTGEGLLIKEVIRGVPLGKLAPTHRPLIARYGIPAELIIVDQQKQRIELH